ncbi:MAG TPA: ABC transporter ATP-binding protein [Dehalococcoidia bacterium]|nr:ABC transporter ATP-binding protein [Dehalococcoidia bacterium]
MAETIIPASAGMMGMKLDADGSCCDSWPSTSAAHSRPKLGIRSSINQRNGLDGNGRPSAIDGGKLGHDLVQRIQGTATTKSQPERQAQKFAVSCRKVTIRYGSTVAVDRVTFDARTGEVLGLLGPNGAGKTSLIRALTTIIPLSEGEATVAGVDRRDPDLIRGRIGVLPENAGYPEHQTAIEYLRYHGRLFGASGRDAQARGTTLLEAVGLADRADHRIRTFSRGMRQRLGIARALINQPQVLFLDEPTLGLDPAGQYEVLGHIRSIATDAGTTVILTSHLLDEVNRVCDRVLILNQGRVVSMGSVNEVVQQSGVGRSVHLRVDPADVGRTVALLSPVPEIASVRPMISRTGGIQVDLVDPGDADINLVAAAVISAGIPMMSIERAGARLDEAFLNLTRLAGEAEQPLN